MYLFHSIFFYHTHFSCTILLALGESEPHFTQLTCSDTMLVWVSNCSSVEHDAGVTHAFLFSPSTTFFPVFLSIHPSLALSLSLSLWALVLFSSLIFPSLSPLIFPIILLLFPIFPKTGFAASSASRILFRCQIKIPGKSAILSQQWNKSRTLRVIWRRMTQIPPLALEQTWGLKLKGRYVAGVRGLFGFVHTLVGCSQAFHSYYSVMILICVFV